MNPLRYYMKAYKSPVMNMTLLTTKPDKVTIAFTANILLSIGLSLISFLRYLLGYTPFIAPFIKLKDDIYYLYQALFITPMFLLLWVLMAGLLYLFSIAGKSASRRFFYDDALIISSVAFVVPFTIVLLFQMVLLVPIIPVDTAGVFHIGLFILAMLWQLVLILLGSKNIFKNKVLKSFLVSFVCNVCFFGVLILFLR